MKKTVEPRFDETFYSETLENGLKLIIWHKPLFTSTSCIFATPYGALDHRQKLEDGTIIEDPSGIAHFLEHKMFESEHGDVMNDFSEMGANVNAYTSYTETCYTFSTSQQDISKPLNLLLDFVQELNISDESVEKEKGIIIQELAMYQQLPDSRLFFETFKALFNQHPLKEDIGGTPDSVSATTKDQLLTCHKRNYHPSKMVLAVVTPVDPQIILNIVKTNQSAKTFEPVQSIARAEINESIETADNHHVINMDVSNTKVSLAYKLKPVIKSDLQRTEEEWAVRCLLESHFTSLNPDYQKWLDEEIINDYFFYEVDFGKDYAVLMFMNETEDAQGFKTFIETQLNELRQKTISLQLLSQLKKRYAGQAMRIFNSSEDIAASIIRGVFGKVDTFTLIHLIESLTQEKISDTFEQLDFSHSSLIEIRPNTKN